MARMKKKAQTWHLRGALGVAAVFVAGLVVSGAFGGVSPLGLTSSGTTDTGSSSTASTGTTSSQGGSTVPYIVTFADGTSSSDQTSEIAAAGATDAGDIAPLSMHSIDVPADSEAAVVAALEANANVADVELDRSRETDAAPNDPGYADQWNLPLIGWDQIYGSANPLGSSTIAVLDTGVSGSTGDLQLGAGWSAFGTDPTQDPNGHGTAVASIAAATAGNGIGIAGVDFGNPTILPVQVLDSNGLGQDSDIIQGVVWAADHGANVILMSFSNPGFSQALQDAVDYAWGKGAVVVAATGNDGSDSPTYPAGDADVMGIAGTDQTDQPWSGSNTGADTFIAAPATQIPADATDGSETSITGTSASAAEVAGAAALLLQNDPSATNAIVDGRLARNADAVGTVDQTGNGRLNLARAAADTSTDAVTPLGAPGGGPLVGPYVAAGNAGTVSGTVTLSNAASPTTATVTCTANCNQTVKTATPAANGAYSFSNTNNPNNQITFSGSSATITLQASAPGCTSSSQNVNVSNGTNVSGINFSLTCTQTADLSVTKTDNKGGSSITSTTGTVVAGTQLIYTVKVSNEGPQTATGASVTDNLPANFTGATWTATQTGGATGFTASGSGNISDTITMPSGSSITYTVTGTVKSSATGTLSNTAGASVAAGTTDPTPGNNSATDNDTITKSADLSVTKTDNKGGSSITSTTGAVAAGASLQYTVKVSNAGPSDAVGATVTDNLPANVTGATWTATGTTGTSFSSTGSGNIADTVTIPSGGSITYTVTGTVKSSATGTLSNTATAAVASGTTDPTPGNNSATDNDTITQSADLSVTKTDNQGGSSITSTTGSVAAGTSLQYTVKVSNAGPSDAVGATVADSFPANFTGANWAATGTTGTSFTSSGTGDIDATVTIPSGGSITYTITGTVKSSATGTLSNTATVSPPSGTTDPTSANNTATDTDTVSPSADLSVTKSDDRGGSSITSTTGSVVAGTGLTYTVTVSNNGPSDAVGAKVTDNFPADFTGATWTATQTGGASGFTAGGSGDIDDTVTMPSGSTITYTVTGTVESSATGTLSNTATASVASGTTDPTPGNNSATDSDAVTQSADLSVTKTDNQGGSSITPTTGSVVAGTQMTYTVRVSNAGPSDAVGATVADSFPSNFTGANWAATGTTGTSFTSSGTGDIDATVTIPSGGSITYTITGTVKSSATGTLSNTATVTAANGTTDAPGNNSATDSDTITQSADLSVVKSDDHGGNSTTSTAGSVVPGTNLTYTVTVANNGPSDSVGAKVTDTFPSEFAGATWTATPTGGAGGFTASGSGNIDDTVDLPAGSTLTYTVTGTVESSATGTLSNTATASDATDPNTANNAATDTDTLTPQADLGVTKDDGTDKVVAGTSTTYTVTLTNHGPSDAPAGQVVSDAAPAGTTISSSDSRCSVSSNTATCTTSAALPAGQNTTFALTLAVDSDYVTAQGSSLTNTASITDSPGLDQQTNAGNDTASDTDTVIARADLSITKDGPSSAVAGSNYSYTLTVKNNGESDNVGGFTVGDTLPSQLSFVSSGSSSSCSAAGQVVTCTESSGLAAGATESFTVVVEIDPATTPGTVIANHATVASTGTTDPNSANDQSSPDTLTTVTSDVALSVTKSFAPDTTVTAGDGQHTFTVKVTNTGTFSTAHDVHVTDSVPAGILVDSVTDDQSGTNCGASSGQSVDCTFALLPAGQTATATVTYHVAADTQAQSVDNTANASSPDNGASGSDTKTLTIVSDVALSLDKTFTPDTVTAGDGDHTFTLAVTNTGTFSTAHSVEITDSVDPRLVVTGVTQDQGSGGSCAAASQSIDCTFSLLPAGQTATVTVTYHVDPSTEAGTVTNDATAASPDNNQSAPASATLTIERDADLSVTKTAATDPTQPDTDETFTVTVKNLGPSDNAGYTLSDAVPAGTSFVSASSGCSYDGSGTVTCTSGGLALNATDTFTITVHVAADYPHNTKLSNTASIASTNTPDSVSGDDSSTVTVDVASIELTKTGSVDETVAGPSDRVDAGDKANYTFRVENTGSVTLTGVEVTDPLTGTDCTIASLAPAAVDDTTCSGSYTLTQDDVDNGSVSNTAQVTADAGNGVQVSDDSSTTVQLPAAPSISLVKTPMLHEDVVAPDDRVDAGDTISYVFSVENTGNVTLSDVTVTDPLTNTNCTIGTLAPGATDASCSATYTLTQSDVDLGSRSNTATATGNPPQGDPVSDDDTATVNLPAEPALQLQKTTQSAPFDHPGQELDYTYTLTNTGNVTLGGPFSIQDDRSTDAACPSSPSSIAPGDSITCTGTYDVTQDDIDAGSVTNHATATANFQSSTITSNQDQATVQAIQNPSVSLTKQVTETTYSQVGDVLHYTYYLTNTGNVTLSNPSVTDTNTDAPVTVSHGNANGKLNVGETWTFTATYTIKQSDLDNGAVSNDATGHTTFNGNPVDSAPQSVTVPATQSPSLTLTKVADTATYDQVGQIINYTYTLQNSGNVTLGQSTVTDDNIDFGPNASYFSGDTNLNGKMDPGETWVFKATHTVNTVDIFEGSIVNNATGSAPFTYYGQGSPTTIYSNPATVTVSNTAADVSITKSASPDPVLVNDDLTYTLTVTDSAATGHSADNVTVSDPVPSGTTFVSASATNNGTCDSTVTCTFASLAPGASATITIVVTPTASGQITNTASVLASESDPNTGNNTASITTTANARPTTLVYNGPTTQDFNDPFTASAKLTDTTTGNPIAGESVTIKLNNAESCSGTTTAAGVASCSITPGETAGTYNVTASFAGDSVYAATSAAPTPFVVTKEETTTTYTGPSGPIQNGTSVTLSGVLKEDGTTPIQGRTLTLNLGSQSCTGTTNAMGLATCSVTVNQPLGPGTAGASFAGDGYYLPSSDSKTTLIYASASGGNGAFVVGDNSGSGNVYFWGSQWSSTNSLSGGAAPSSFKGFAKQPGTPSCGATWSTDPGNSAPPPTGPLPSYIAVIVTSKSTKSGSQITGNIVHIVIVKVNAGYTTDPGHPGTGSVVATVC